MPSLLSLKPLGGLSDESVIFQFKMIRMVINSLPVLKELQVAHARRLRP
jgi:hypothetical protein